MVPPDEFKETHAADLVGWDGSAADLRLQEFVRRVCERLGRSAQIPVHTQRQLALLPAVPPLPEAALARGRTETFDPGSLAERDWREHGLDTTTDIGLIEAYAAQWQAPAPLWAYKARTRASAVREAEAHQRDEAEARERARRAADEAARLTAAIAGTGDREALFRLWQQHPERGEAIAARLTALGFVYVAAGTAAAPQHLWLKPGDGKTEWFRDLDAPVAGGQPEARLRSPEMVVVPAGTFQMGSSPEEIAALVKEDGNDWPMSEGPRREVTIAQPFAIGRFTVTFDEWDRAQKHPQWQEWSGIAPREPHDAGWGRGKQPVIDVHAADADAYCRWLAKATGKPYRLPSEAEWEYACRAGTTTAFWWGDGISTDQANYDGEFAFGPGGQKGKYLQRTLPVESFAATPWGLYQVHGNVWEYCADPWHGTYDGAPVDGSV